MKKILVVEDVLENLDTAKAFFSAINDFEFVYASNRKDAEKLLGEVFAVITDRSLPSKSGLEFLDCEVPEGQESIVKYVAEGNGYHIMYSAYSMNLPVIMISEHGSTSLYLPKGDEPNKEVGFYRSLKNFSLKNLLLEIDENPSFNAYNTLQGYGNNDVISLGNYNLKKTQTNAWSHAWTELQNQF